MTKYFWPYYQMNRKPDNPIYLSLVTLFWRAIIYLLIQCYKGQLTHRNWQNVNWTKYLVQNSTFGPMVFNFFGPMVSFTNLFGHLVFYLFGPLDSVYWTSSLDAGFNKSFDRMSTYPFPGQWIAVEKLLTFEVWNKI